MTVTKSPTALSSRCLGTRCEPSSATRCSSPRLCAGQRPGELITRAELEAAANRWVSRRSKGSRVRKNRRLGVREFTGQAVRWLSFLGRMQVPAAVRQPYADQVSEFTDYMVRERGLSPSTVTYSRGTILEFLAQIDKADLRLKMLTAADVNELLAGRFGTTSTRESASGGGQRRSVRSFGSRKVVVGAVAVWLPRSRLRPCTSMKACRLGHPERCKPAVGGGAERSPR